MRIYSATDVGQKRKMNQDYVFATADPVGNLPNLFVVADGMGGHNAGDYASSHAVTSMVEEIRQDADFNPVKVIRHAIECVNTEILAQAQPNADHLPQGADQSGNTVMEGLSQQRGKLSQDVQAGLNVLEERQRAAREQMPHLTLNDYPEAQ